MKNKILFSLFGIALALPLALGAKGSKASEVKADHGAEADVTTVWVDELTGFNGSATHNADGSVTCAGTGSFVFEQSLSNVEVKSRISFPNGANWNAYFTLFMCQPSDLATEGYAFEFNAYGNVNLRKNGTALTSASNAAFAINPGDVRTYALSTRTCADESVHISVKIDGTTLLDYYDEDSPLTSGYFGGSTFWLPYTAMGELRVKPQNVNLPDYCDAITGIAVGEVKDSGVSVTTSGTGISGVGYTHPLREGGFSFKTEITVASGTNVALQIGAIRGVFMQINNNIVSPTDVGGGGWWWDRSGYVLWMSGAHWFLTDSYYSGGTVYADTWGGVAMSGTAHEVEYVLEVRDGANIITVNVDGSEIWSVKHSNSPLPFVLDGSVEYTSGVYTENAVATFKFAKNTISSTGDEVVVGQRRSITDSRIVDPSLASYEVTNLSGEAAVTAEGRLTASQVGLVKSVITYDGTPFEPQYFFITSGNDAVKDSEQALAWASYFINKTRTEEVCMAATDELKLAGLQAVWGEFAASYEVLSVASKQEFCESENATIVTARNHYISIVAKFGAENLGVDGAFVTDGTNPLAITKGSYHTEPTTLEGSAVAIIIVAVISVSAIGLILISKKRKSVVSK